MLVRACHWRSVEIAGETFRSSTPTTQVAAETVAIAQPHPGIAAHLLDRRCYR